MSDYDYLSASNGSGDAALMHVAAPGRLVGASVIPVDTVVNVPTKVIATSGTLLPSGLIDPATATNFKAHISGSTLVIDAYEPGSTDIGHTAGQVIILKPTTGWTNRVAAFIKNATGLGTPEALTAASLDTTGEITAGNGFTLSAGPMTAPTDSLAGLGGAWDTWSPTLTNITKGNGTEVARYLRVGKTIYFYYSLTFGTTTTIAGATSKITLPLAASGTITQYSNIGEVAMFDTSAGTSYHGPFILDTAARGIANVIKVDVTYAFGVDVTTAVPMTWATGDRLTVMGHYEAA